ncbi:MetQ/NlpA family ABC transporter substrate-binding protein, partial [Stenotrophomonas maltophilia]
MKKTLLLPLLAAALALTACGKSGEPSQKLVVAATAVPHAEILEVVKPILKQEGVDLDVRVFNDYVQPN